MSNKKNYRRDELRRSEHGPRYENSDPGKGANSTHVARGRARWKRINQRKDRRASKQELDNEVIL